MRPLEDYSTSTLRDELRRRVDKDNETTGPPEDGNPDMHGAGPELRGFTPAMRQSAADLLCVRARNLRRQADQCEALAKALPAALAELSPDADLALWGLLSGMGPRP